MAETAREVQFHHRNQQLSGTLHLPHGTGPHPGVVIVHGSGAVDRDGADGTLVPIVEHFVRARFAVLSYDKPGVGRSTGDWTAQTFGDRAEETLAAVRFMRRHASVHGDQVGLWGISQGGWIAPLAAVSPGADVAFVIVVSASAITPHAQSSWLVEHQLRADGFAEEQISRALDVVEQRTTAMAGDATSEEILASECQEMCDEPWYERFISPPGEVDFIRAIWEFDPVPVLQRLRAPLLAIWGSHDVHMPVRKCATVFAAALERSGNDNFRLQVFPHADHRLREAAGNGPAETGREIVAGYLTSMTDWLFHSVL